MPVLEDSIKPKPPAAEIEEFLVWCIQHQKQEEVWEIRGVRYFIKSTPYGFNEIIGLYSRFHNQDSVVYLIPNTLNE